MSIILDALRKSENERRRQERPGFSDLPVASRPAGLPTWVPVTLVVLAATVVLLGVGLWQLRGWVPTATPVAELPAPATPGPAVAVAPPPVVATDPEPEPEPVVAAIIDRSVRPLAREVAPPSRPASESVPDTAPATRPARAATPVEARASDLPSLDELTTRGELTLPELHMDLHVYATDPAQRFVFINGRRLRHGDETAGGVRVVEILADGVILQHGGMRFVLPRD